MSFPRYPKYKPSGVEWLGAVPEHWELRRLGFLADERREKVSDRDFAAISVTKLGLVPQLETAAKTDDGDNRRLVRKGDFVINSRSDRRGSAGVAPMDGSVSLINTVLALRDSLIAAYAHHLLRSGGFQEEFYRFGKGIVADLWSTNFSEMKDILIPIPTPIEQRAIAAFLDRETAKIDGLIAGQEKLIELLAEKRQAVISHAVTKGLNPAAPLKPSGVEWLGDVPAHWDVVPVASIAQIVNGYPFDSEMFDSTEGTPLVRIRDLGRDSTEARFRGRSIAAAEITNADVLIGMDGDFNVGRWHGNGTALLNQRMCCVRAANAMQTRLLEYALPMPLRLINAVTYATTVKHLASSQVGKTRVAVPTQTELESIISFLDHETAKIDVLVAEAEKAIDLLRERRSALISAAVTGQIDVRNAVLEPVA